MAYVSFKAGLLAVLLAFAGLFTLTSTTRAEVVDVHLTARPATVKIDDGVKLRAWTFNGTVPGPVIRATEGDTVRVTLT
ncbi:MAG TPA: multicopper oxidase domain-containing protein, partial [Solirubrobacterales bacterium]|nr:multicopper oxidase domain-containing protein [Solirubrobacterales bacterium]